MARYIPIGPPTNTSEKRGIRRLRDRLPDHFIVIGNFDLTLPRRKNTLEYDAVVLGEWGVYAVEIKGWGGRIEGDIRRWEMPWGRVQNPFIRNETKAKALRDVLVRNVDGFPDELFVESVVFLTPNDVDIRVEDPRNDRLIRMSDVWRFFVEQHVESGPGLLEDDALRERICDAIIPRAEPGPTGPHIPNYEIEDEIGTEVGDYDEFVGSHQLLSSRQQVRIKAYSVDPLVEGEEREDQFARAIRDLEVLNQLERVPYVARGYDIFRDEEDELTVYSVSEWVGSETLEQHRRWASDISECERSEMRQRLEMGLHLTRAVHDIHDHGVVHRNLHPAAIYLTENGTDVPFRVADFDLSRIHHDRSISDHVESLGAEGYVAPELWNHQPHDHRVDYFSLGILVWEMLTGRQLFPSLPALLDFENTWSEKRGATPDDEVRAALDELVVPREERAEDLTTLVSALRSAIGRTVTEAGSLESESWANDRGQADGWTVSRAGDQASARPATRTMFMDGDGEGSVRVESDE